MVAVMVILVRRHHAQLVVVFRLLAMAKLNKSYTMMLIFLFCLRNCVAKKASRKLELYRPIVPKSLPKLPVKSIKSAVVSKLKYISNIFKQRPKPGLLFSFWLPCCNKQPRYWPLLLCDTGVNTIGSTGIIRACSSTFLCMGSFLFRRVYLGLSQL